MGMKLFRKALKERDNLLTNELRNRIHAICNLYVFREPFLQERMVVMMGSEKKSTYPHYRRLSRYGNDEVELHNMARAPQDKLAGRPRPEVCDVCGEFHPPIKTPVEEPICPN
jgi:hypothetical protein